MDNNGKIKSQTQTFNGDWKEGFDANLKRPDSKDDFLGGANFDATLDELLFNRMLMLKNIAGNTIPPQGNDQGKIYWDKDNQKYKLWVGNLGKWVDVQWTSTSTSSTSSSSSSSSTSSTSSSSTSHSTSSSSTSTTHT